LRDLDLRDLDLRVPAGSIFGFLGHNGAEKTTTIMTLMGLFQPVQPCCDPICTTECLVALGIRRRS
jgi:ABC-type uncharacterized transport system ATPase subunit